MRVQLVYNKDPPRIGGRLDHRFDVVSEILLRPSRPHRGGDDLARSHLETGNQGLRAVADVLKFAQCDVAWLHGLRRMFALGGLDTGLLIA